MVTFGDRNVDQVDHDDQSFFEFYVPKKGQKLTGAD